MNKQVNWKYQQGAPPIGYVAVKHEAVMAGFHPGDKVLDSVVYGLANVISIGFLFSSFLHLVGGHFLTAGFFFALAFVTILTTGAMKAKIITPARIAWEMRKRFRDNYDALEELHGVATKTGDTAAFKAFTELTADLDAVKAKWEAMGFSIDDD